MASCGAVGVIGELRSLGLTLAEIEQPGARYYLERLDQSVGVARMLDRAQERISAPIQALPPTHRRIQPFRAANAKPLAGTATPDAPAADPCCPCKRAT